jgi:hypothetical protein
LEKLFDGFPNLLLGGFQIIVNNHSIELRGVSEFFLGFGQSLLNGFFRVSPTTTESFLKLLQGRRLDKQGETFFWELLFDIESPHNIDIKKDMLS